MQERSIDSALIALRKLTIRESRDGLAHVEALLVLRGVRLPAVLPCRRPDAARRGHMSALVMEALRGGPKPLRVIAEHVASERPEISARAAYIRTGQTLDRLKRKGRVVQGRGPDGCLWRPSELLQDSI